MSLSGWTNFGLKIRDNGTWYVQHSGVERKEGSCLSGSLQNGDTPEEAIEQCWKWATNPDYYLVKDAYKPERRAVKWNGFMWEDTQENQ